MEEWKLVERNHKYEVSSYGRVRRVGKVDCLRVNYNTTGGYGRVSLGNSNTSRVHSVVATAFLGKKPSTLQINHKDSDKKNNRADNLEYITGSENCKQVFTHGLRSLKGENHNRAKLSSADVQLIREMLNKGDKNKDIAKLFSLDPSSISHIKRGKSWHYQEKKHIN